jgi:hypothetical protein
MAKIGLRYTSMSRIRVQEFCLLIENKYGSMVSRLEAKGTVMACAIPVDWSPCSEAQLSCLTTHPSLGALIFE